MLAGVGKLFSNVKALYNDINPATLTGAIDVVVVEQPDGSYVSSPFHVRFGKLGVIRSKQNVVYIEINGEPTDLQMKLGQAGEAFFVQGVQEEWEGPEYLATSPIVSSPIAEAVKLRSTQSESNVLPKHTKKTHVKRERRVTEISNSSSSSASDLSASGTKKDQQTSFGFIPINQQDDELLESGGMFDIEVDEENRVPVPAINMGLSKSVSLPLIQESSITRTESWAINTYHKSSHFHPFSDTDITPLVSPVGSRPATPKSDTEYEYADRKDAAMEPESLQQWEWGELPDSSKKLANTIVTQVDETNSQTQDQNAASPDDIQSSSGLFAFMRRTKNIRHKAQLGDIYLDDLDTNQMDPEMAALYLTAPKSPKICTRDEPDKAANSHIATVSEDETESGQGASLPRSPINISPLDKTTVCSSLTSESGTMRDHECGVYGDVAMSLCGAHIDSYNDVPTEVFEQYLIDFTTFTEKPTELLQLSDLVVRISGKYYNWMAAAPMVMSIMSFHQTLPEDAQQTLVKKTMSKKNKRSSKSRWWPLSWGGTNPPPDVESGNASNHSTPNGSPRKTPATIVSRSMTDKHSESDGEADDEKEQEPSFDVNAKSEAIPTEKHYMKTLRLTSEELERLNLHEGENEIEFSVTTAYQGTARCDARIFLWKHTDKVVISDIDGTITRSDIMGQIFPMVGKDWSQSGVTELYTKISQNGYRFAYLSARAIGQAQMTRDYLKSVKQGELTLPSGPVFLNPSSLMNAFHKEVIEKKPEEFKISCMSDIKSLFSSDTALYAGFGNRVNDIYAYRAVGIPKARMFLIDPSGKVKADFCKTFQTSYSNLSDVTDHYFPPVEELGGETSLHSPADFSDFTFWREPVPDISFQLPD